MSLYAVSGLPVKIELPVPLYVDLISPYQKNQRPGLTLWSPPKWIQHETANENAGADASMHNRWLHSGADGQVVSFHFVVDDHSIYQMIPITEVTWQAADGNGPGNFQCISCELCVNAGADERKARNNAEALCGGILKALGQPASAIGRHWDYNFANDPSVRHHCPDHMMNEGYWPTFVANAAKIIQGGAPVPPSDPNTYPPGLDAALCTKWFGSLTVAGRNFSYDPDGPVSQVWLETGKATGEYPTLIGYEVYDDGPKQRREYFRFANGLVLWRTSGQPIQILQEAA